MNIYPVHLVAIFWLELPQTSPLIKVNIFKVHIFKVCLCNSLKFKTIFHTGSFDYWNSIHVSIMQFSNMLLAFGLFCLQSIRLIQVNSMSWKLNQLLHHLTILRGSAIHMPYSRRNHGIKNFSPAGEEVARKDLSYRFQRKHGSVDTLIANFWPLQLRDHTCL